MAVAEPIRGTPASDSHEMPLLLHQRLPLLDVHGVIHLHDFETTSMDEEPASVVGQQSIAVDGRNDPHGECNPVPLNIVRPENMEIGQQKHPGFCYEEGAKRRITISYKRRRGTATGFKSPKSKMGQKPALFDRSSSGDSSYSKGDKDENFEPPTPTRKRRRPTASKSAKRKTEQKLQSVDRSSREVYHDDGRKKYARVKGTAEDRAAELDEKLPPECPSFVKCMTYSQVVEGFWLGLPAMFCRKHLPNINVDIELEDEEGHICVTRYKSYKTGLSGGWRGFVKQQHLEVDNALVFQLVTPTRFKVYILRENKFTTTDAALGLLSLDTSKKNYRSKKVERSDKVTKSKENEPEVVTREEAGDGGIRPPGPDIGDFVQTSVILAVCSIIVCDGWPLVLSDRLHATYYHLCHARKALPHKHLMSHTDVAEMIEQTAKIAEGIRASSAASVEDLAGWKVTLESLELKGMDVSFMRKRIEDLLRLLGAPSSTSSLERYEKVKLERAHLAKQMRAFESRVSILKDTLNKTDVQMKEMVEVNAKKKKDQAVRKLATVPW